MQAPSNDVVKNEPIRPKFEVFVLYCSLWSVIFLFFSCFSFFWKTCMSWIRCTKHQFFQSMVHLWTPTLLSILPLHYLRYFFKKNSNHNFHWTYNIISISFLSRKKFFYQLKHMITIFLLELMQKEVLYWLVLLLQMKEWNTSKVLQSLFRMILLSLLLVWLMKTSQPLTVIQV